MKKKSQLFKYKRSKRIFGPLLSREAFNSVFKLLSGQIKPPPEAVQKSGQKYLIINGDDLCRDDSTDEAIITGFKKGILTSASAFINYPDSVARLKNIHRNNPNLPIGLHLNLTDGKPVMDSKEVKELTDKNGRFCSIDKILNHLQNMPVEKVKKEMQAQVELFLSSGVALNHIDYHFHLAAAYVPLFKIVSEIAVKYKIPVRNPVPFSIYQIMQPSSDGGGSSTGMRKLLLFALTHPKKSIPLILNSVLVNHVEQKQQIQTENIMTTDWFIDSFYNNARPEVFISILEQLPSGISEIVCHPGNDNELQVILDKSVRNAIEKLNIQLITYDHLNTIRKTDKKKSNVEI